MEKENGHLRFSASDRYGSCIRSDNRVMLIVVASPFSDC